MIKKTEGFIAAPLTGFKADGSVNLDIIPRYAAMLHSNGVAGVFVNGTTGEGMSLTLEERQALAERWVDSAPQDLRVFIHVGYTQQDESQALAIHAADIGADAVAEIGPANLNTLTVEALVDYIADTAGSVPDMPYYYYHMPSMNNVLLPMIEFLQLAETAVPNLAGIKYTHDDIADYKQSREFNNEKYDILFGRDELLIDGLKAGALGGVGSTFNFMVSLYHKLVKSFHAGNLENAQQLQTVSADACRILHDAGNFRSGLKTVMRKIGLDLGDMRSPQIDLTPDQVKDLELSLQKSGAFNFLNKV